MLRGWEGRWSDGMVEYWNIGKMGKTPGAEWGLTSKEWLGRWLGWSDWSDGSDLSDLSTRQRTMKLFSRSRWWMLAVVAGLGLALGPALLLRTPPLPPPPIIVMRPPYALSRQQTPLLERWLPRAASFWVWRLKRLVLGKLQVINVSGCVVRLGEDAAGVISEVAGKQDFTETNGVRVWLLPNTQLDQLRLRLQPIAGNEMVFSPRISTADGIQASMFVGSQMVLQGVTNQVGSVLDCLVRVRKQVNELTTAISLTEVVTNDAGPSNTSVAIIKTNLDLAARLQVPKGSGVLILDTRADGENRKRMAFILSVTQPPGK
jgi:hypothetical protein